MTTAVINEAGRAMDAAIAENMVGFTRWKLGRQDISHVLALESVMRDIFTRNHFAEGWVAPAEPGAPLDLVEGLNHVPHYSTDLVAAFTLMAAFGFDEYWSLAPVYEGPFAIQKSWAITVEGDTCPETVAIADTPQLAICRAVLSLPRRFPA